MLKVIQADGVKLGQSEKFSPRQLKDKARAITTDAQNGVMVWTEANAELSEMSGGGGTILAAEYIPRTDPRRRLILAAAAEITQR